MLIDNLKIDKFAQNSLENSWYECIELLKKATNNLRISAWVSPLRLIDISNGVAYFTSVSNLIHTNYVLKHFSEPICSAMSKLGIEITKIDVRQIVVEKNSNVVSLASSVSDEDDAKSMSTTCQIEQARNDIKKAQNNKKRLFQLNKFNSNYTFEKFVDAPCNCYAYEAAKNVSSAPGSIKCNPLIMYGGTGLGKTHLLKAIGRESLELHTADKVKICTAENFLRDCVAALRSNTMGAFMHEYTSADVLLIDDIQFLRGQETLKVFHRIFCDMVDKKKQIVITCDVVPSKIKTSKVAEKEIYTKLLRRFESGLLANLDKPSLDTRVDILKHKIDQGLCERDLSSDVLMYVAEHYSNNVRELEGVLLKFQAFGELVNSNVEIDMDFAKQILSDTIKDQVNEVNIPRIMECVAKEFGVKSQLLAAKTRVQAVVLARQIAMYLCHLYTKNTDKTIGLNFNRDHSTVHVSVKRMKTLLGEDQNIVNHINKIKTELGMK